MSDEEALRDDQLVLADLINNVLDKGIVISGEVTISIADIDLLILDLRLLLTSVQTALDRGVLRRDGDVPVLRAGPGAG